MLRGIDCTVCLDDSRWSRSPVYREGCCGFRTFGPSCVRIRVFRRCTGFVVDFNDDLAGDCRVDRMGFANIARLEAC